MSRRNSRADLILKGARERVRVAERALAIVNGHQEVASATLYAHRISLEAIEKDLAQTPRKVKDPKSTAPAVKGRSSRKPGKVDSSASTVTDKVDAGPVCAVPLCGLEESANAHNIHHSDFVHVFHAEIKKKEKIVLPENPDDFHSKAASV